MMKRVVNSKLPLIVYYPIGNTDVNYFRSIHQAGSLPVMDCEYMNFSDIKVIIENLSKTDIIFGIKIACKDVQSLSYINQQSLSNLDLLVLSYRDKSELSTISTEKTSYKLFIEVCDVDILDSLKVIQPHGLILKGNEAGGRTSKYSSFILMQWYLKHCSIPVFIQGGVGMHTAAGMFAAGVSGIVLDSQLFLCDQCPLEKIIKEALKNADDKSSLMIEGDGSYTYRINARLHPTLIKKLKDWENDSLVLHDARSLDEIIKTCYLETSASSRSIFFLGQDILFSTHFIRQSTSLIEVIHRLFDNIHESLSAVDEYDPMIENSVMSQELNRRFPVIQGPMANISDNAEFAKALSDQGAMPFMALGNLPKELAEDILNKTIGTVNNIGAGVIGLESNEKVFSSHLELIRQYKINHVIVAGGNPKQIKALENNAVKAYLHTPSPNSFNNALQNKVQRLILEGNEAGGHVGALTSFVLWECCVEMIMNKESIQNITILFAGGIAGQYASCFISGLSSKLVKKGVKIGVSIATPYLFTEEIVATGALSSLYQKLLIERHETVLIGKSMNLQTRTIHSPFSVAMIANEKRLLKENRKDHQRKELFEKDNFGSHLIASKSIMPIVKDKDLQYTYKYYDQEEQYSKGNFISGDALLFYKKTKTIGEIHRLLFLEKKLLYRHLDAIEVLTSDDAQINDEIAVVGMGGFYPDAKNLEQFWQNIVDCKYSIKEVPQNRFDSNIYYDKNRSTADKSYTKIAGVIDNFNFDHTAFGMNAPTMMSRSQQFLITAAQMAMTDAGYDLNALSGNRSIVITANCLGEEFQDRHHRFFFPELMEYLEKSDAYLQLTSESKHTLKQHLKESFDKVYPDSPLESSLINTEATTLAHLLAISGPAFSVDAACATSFIAVDCAIKSLLSAESDTAIVGGVNANLSPEIFVGFSKVGGLSDKGSFPFDERANGFVIGEGCGVLILKRMKDAIRDKNKIHVIIKGIGTSSDGKGKAIAAPNSEGQALAIQRCFEKIKTDFSFEHIDYIEAHGTSTLAGDAAEINTLKQIYATQHKIGISSVKSQIGHLIGGAGMAGIIKAILSIQHKTLPPNGLFENVADRIHLKAPFYVIEKQQEWHKEPERARAAAVSSFGFGGINTHVVVEEYTTNYQMLSRNIFQHLDHDFNNDRLVIVGAGCVVPGANSVDQFLTLMKEGHLCLRDIPEDRVGKIYTDACNYENYRIHDYKSAILSFELDNSKYRIPPNTLKTIDKIQLLALEAASQAIKSISMGSLLTKGNRVGVIMGSTMHGDNLCKAVVRTRWSLVEKMISECLCIDEQKKTHIIREISELIKSKYLPTTEDTLVGYLANIISGRIANFFNCNGANFSVDAASVSSAMAMSMAIKGLKNEDYEFVLTGGSDSNFTPSVLKGFEKWGLLSDVEGKVFAQNSNGVNLSEGAVVLVLTKYKSAIKYNMPILAEITDFTCFNNPEANPLSPDKSAYHKAMENYYLKNSSLPKEINYFEVNAISNVLFDLMEYQSIKKIISHQTYWGTIKTKLAYLKSVNPAAVLLKLSLMNKHQIICEENEHRQQLSIIEPESFLQLPDKMICQPADTNNIFAANFFGIGGNHMHTNVKRLPQFLGQKNTQSPFVDLKPKAIINEQDDTDLSKSVLLLSGQGSQYVGMMQKLYQTNDVIKSTMDKGNSIFRKRRGYSLLDLMFTNEELLLQTINTQPAVFLCSAALFDYYHNMGLSPSYFLGHSLGEFSALYCSDMLSLEDCMNVIIKRADLMHEAALLNPGLMLSLPMNADQSIAIIARSGIPKIWMANKNGEKQSIVTGGTDEIKAFAEYLRKDKIVTTLVNVKTAFHSPFFTDASVKFREYLQGIDFDLKNSSGVYSNVTAQIYPADSTKIKDLLAKQMYSPVEFIDCVKDLSILGIKHYIELGPGKILTNIIRNANIPFVTSEHAIDKKSDECDSMERLTMILEEHQLVKTNRFYSSMKSMDIEKIESMEKSQGGQELLFDKFMSEKKEVINQYLIEEFNKYSESQRNNAVEAHGFYTGDIVISGVAVGLPGTQRKVFDESNFDSLLSGTNYIENLSNIEKEKMLDKNILKLDKGVDGNARFLKIQNTDEVLQLAARLGYFDLKDYGIDYEYDKTYQLAIAAGIEALKDAQIPLVLHRKKTSTGNYLDEGYALPMEMQNRTGVILSSAFPGFDTIIDEMTRYYNDKFVRQPFLECEKIYYYLIENIKDQTILKSLTDWFSSVRANSSSMEPYRMNREILFNITALGSAHFAQIVKAKGPNIHVNAACASTTHAVGIAEDWIRNDRCDRVVILAAEVPTSENLNQWIGSGMLALGAASVKKVLSEAALPFDARRNGLILGSGAASLIIEREDSVICRGMNGQAKIMGTYIGNSAFHVGRIDGEHVATEVVSFMNKMEQRHGLTKEIYSSSLLFMSHETYTPARGGSSDSEVTALKRAFPDNFQNITITNTKGFTGHTLGAGIEDAVMVKALQKRKAPPLANLKHIPDEFSNLKFSNGGEILCEYGLHFAAGFGSHFSMLFVKRIECVPVQENAKYNQWLKKISGLENPKLSIINNSLCIAADKTKHINPLIPIEEKQSTTVEAMIGKPIEEEKVIIEKVKSIIAELTGYTVDMLEDELDLEGDLGIDTVKQVEVFGKISAAFQLEVPEDLRLSQYNSISKLAAYVAGNKSEKPIMKEIFIEDTVTTAILHEVNTIKQIISELTGYTVDMLEDELDLEGDLGIDTVKQVEVFGKISAAFQLEVPENLRLSQYNSISKLAAYVAGNKSEKSKMKEIVIEDTVTTSILHEVNTIKKIISELTGYAIEMLEDDLDLEGDLGIDTVKQVEVFGKISAAFQLEVPEDLRLSQYNSISKLAAYVAGNKSEKSKMKEIVIEDTVTTSILHEVNTIKKIISELTGYAIEMLEDDLDLEGDLGIDTVKQVEVFGKISAAFQLEVPEDLKLSQYNNITKLAEYVAGRTVAISDVKENITNDMKPMSEVQKGINRFVILPQVIQQAEKNKNLFHHKRLLVTSDNAGFTEELKRQVIPYSCEIITIGNQIDDSIKIDFNNINQFEEQIKNVDLSMFDGLIHLEPLSHFFDKKENSERASISIKALFLLLRQMHPFVIDKNCLIASISFQSLIFPYAGSTNIFPLFAGIGGLFKSLNKELSNAKICMVDFDEEKPCENISTIITSFLNELMNEDHYVETGIRQNKRYRLSYKQALAEKDKCFIERGSTILVVGGARGITYELCKSLVRNWSVNLIIVGTTNLSDLRDNYEYQSLNNQNLMTALKQKNKLMKPLDVRNAANHIIKLKEIEKNLELLRSFGTKIDYEVADVNHYSTLESIISQRSEIDGVIFGAGVDESNFIEQKTLSSFNRVFDTKVKGVTNVLKLVDTYDYRFFIAFSSIAAVIGNAGQIDYSAANDMMGKILLREKNIHADRIYKIFDWTAWEGIGMASLETISKVLKEKGIEFLPIDKGVQFFIDELSNTTNNEIVIAGTSNLITDNEDIEKSVSTILPDLPCFIDKILNVDHQEMETEYTFSMEKDLYLHSHIWNEVPVVPGTFMAEIMAQNAITLIPNRHFVKLYDFEMHHFIKLFKNRDYTIRTKTKVIQSNEINTVVKVSVFTSLNNSYGQVVEANKLMYESKIQLNSIPINFNEENRMFKQKAMEYSKKHNVSHFDLKQLYKPDLLFMGPLMQTIKETLHIEDNLAIVKLSYSMQNGVLNKTHLPFIIDPIIIDGALQSGGMMVLTFLQFGLPKKVGSINKYKNISNNDSYYVVCCPKEHQQINESRSFICDLFLYDLNWDIVLLIHNFEIILLNKIEPEKIKLIFKNVEYNTQNLKVEFS